MKLSFKVSQWYASATGGGKEAEKKKERAKKKKPHKQNKLFQLVVKTLETKQNTLFQKKNINKRNIPFVQWFAKNFIHALQFGWVGAEGNDPFSTLRWPTRIFVDLIFSHPWGD